LASTYKAILLDLDGTFVDTALDFIEVVNALRAQLSLAPISAKTVRQTVSKGASALTQLATDLPDTHPDFEPHKENLLKTYEGLNGQYARLFSGMTELMDWCADHRIPWGIVTNKPLRFARPLMAKLQLPNPARALICPDHVTHNKPHPESLLLAAQEMNVQPECCIYVGDHARDIIAGKSAGMYTLAALYGYLDDKDTPSDWGYDAELTNSEQILEHVQSLIATRHS
jgi:phosphoglycolate phosphatase